MVRQGSSQAIRFSVMESLGGWYTGAIPTSPYQNHWWHCLVPWLGNTPVDVVKTRMQNGSYSVLPRMNRVCLEVGLPFCIFDTLMELFKKV